MLLVSILPRKDHTGVRILQLSCEAGDTAIAQQAAEVGPLLVLCHLAK